MSTLIIMRHGEAEPLAATDAQRALTVNGQLACKAAASVLHTKYLSDLESLQIYHSPYLRTTQTAVFVAKQISTVGSVDILLEANDILLETHTPAQLARWINGLNLNAAETVMLISHQPLVSLLTAWLVGGEKSSNAMANYPMMPASVAVLKFEFAERGCATLASLQHYV